MLVSSCRLRASLPRSLLPCLPALVPRFFHVVLPSLAESWRHPGVYFQSWKFDGGLGCWYLMQNGWLRCVVDEFCPGLLTFIGSFPWIVSPCGIDGFDGVVVQLLLWRVPRSDGLVFGMLLWRRLRSDGLAWWMLLERDGGSRSRSSVYLWSST